MSKWLFPILVLTIAASAGVVSLEKVGDRLGDLEREGRAQPAHVLRLTQQLASVREELEVSRERIATYEARLVPRTAIDARFAEMEEMLGKTYQTISDQSKEIEEVETRQGELLSERLGTSMRDLNADLEERWQNVSRTLEATMQVAEMSRTSVDDLARDLNEARTVQRDPEGMWFDLMGPTVQIADESTVGSGVLLESRHMRGDIWQTHILTAWHVVRDIIDSPDDLDESIPLRIYEVDGTNRSASAKLLEYDPRIDIALLLLESREEFPHGARLASRTRVASLRIFDEVYAVGCPLGNDPIPTHGEIADTNHLVDDDSYWMISAPTYIGNSGGGIFDAKSHELLGIFSKIYTHGNLRPTVVPHMGLVTPLDVIYSWLEEVGHEDLIVD